MENLDKVFKFIQNYPDLFLNFGLGLILFVILIFFLGLSFFTYFSAYIADIDKENRGFANSLFVTILNSLVVLIFTLVLSIVPIFGTIVGFLMGILISYGFIKILFKTTFRKALIVLIFFWFFQMVFILTVVLYLFLKQFPFDILKSLLLNS